MICLDDIRAALTAEVPSRAFDALVRAELAAGQTPRQVHDALAGLLPAVQDWPEYDGEPREDLNGTLDALAGWCHPSARYEAAPPESPRASPGFAPVPAEPRTVT